MSSGPDLEQHVQAALCQKRLVLGLILNALCMQTTRSRDLKSSHFYIGPQSVHIHQISLKSGEVEV